MSGPEQEMRYVRYLPYAAVAVIAVCAVIYYQSPTSSVPPPTTVDGRSGKEIAAQNKLVDDAIKKGGGILADQVEKELNRPSSPPPKLPPSKVVALSKTPVVKLPAGSLPKLPVAPPKISGGGVASALLKGVIGMAKQASDVSKEYREAEMERELEKWRRETSSKPVAPAAVLPPKPIDLESLRKLPASPFPMAHEVSPLIGVWHLSRLDKGTANPYLIAHAHFHADGQFAIGKDLSKPDLEWKYRYADGTLTFESDAKATESQLPVWDKSGDEFRLSYPDVSLIFRRRPIEARLTGVRVMKAPPAALVIQAKLAVDCAPGIPLEGRCKVYDEEGKPIRAKTGSIYADADGLLGIRLPLQGKFNFTVFNEFRLQIPLAELPETSRGKEVRYTLAVWCPGTKKDVTVAPEWGSFILDR